MSLFLRVQEGKEFRDAAILAEGDSLIVGRAEAADVAFPRDGEMSSRHVSLTVRDGQCLFSDLHSTNGTFLNGEAATEGTLLPGATLQCGLTIFTIESGQAASSQPDIPSAAVKLESSTVASGTAPSTSPPQEAVPTSLPEELLLLRGFVSHSAQEIVDRFKIADLLAMDPRDEESPGEFADRLLSSGDDNDCLTFLSYALPKRLGVCWALKCLRSEDNLIAAKDTATIEAVEAWIAQPTDSSRRKAMELAEATGMDSAGAWLAVTAFWSHGSMGPKDQPDVPVEDNMAGKSLAGAVILASVTKSPEKAPDRRKAFVELAIDVKDGDHSLPANA